MALHVPKAPGFAQMLKEGARVSVFGFKCIKTLTNSYYLINIIDAGYVNLFLTY